MVKLNEKELQNVFAKIKPDIAEIVFKYIEKITQRSVMDDRVLKMGSPQIKEWQRGDVAHAIGKFIMENGFVDETSTHEREYCHVVTDLRAYVIKHDDIKNLVNELLLYLVKHIY